jgi:multicomponent Na+:H+ antiporter subunit E
VITSIYLLPTTNISWYELLKFAPIFIFRSLTGGIDVARRALHPKLPICPALIEYPLRLSNGLPRVFFINTVSLMPGTLVADANGDTLKVHVLDETGEFIDEMRSIEQTIAKIFVVTLDQSESSIGANDESI